MELEQYRKCATEIERTADLMRLAPPGCGTVLDIGARDGHFSKLLAEKYEHVTALDLKKPSILRKNILCVQGDITDLKFDDNSYDLVFCAEVLEHIPSILLKKACLEIGRVSNKYLIIGVPYDQDIRSGRTTCYTCGKKPPPWGHVNSFNESILKKLFSHFSICEISFVGKQNSRTNFASTYLMDFSGNPYGTYTQEETCIYCNNKLINPPDMTATQKVSAKIAVYMNRIQKIFLTEKANWIHILLKKSAHSPERRE